MPKLRLFDNLFIGKIVIKFKMIPDISDFKSSLKSKILEIKDITNRRKTVILSFDLEGRIMNIKLKDEIFNNEVKIFERGFDGKFYIYSENCKNLNPNNKSIYQYYDYYNETVNENLEISEIMINSINSFLKGISARKNLSLAKDKFSILERAYSLYGWRGLLNERFKVQKIYCNSISVLPPEVRPDQNPTFSIIQIAQGCWIKDKKGPCKFCDSYKDINYREKSIKELEKHIGLVINNSGKGWRYVKKIFLLDADPLHTNIKTETYFKFLKKKISKIKWYESFISTLTILSKPVSEWEKIKKLGLKKVYWGVESADDKTLMFLGKSHTNKMLYNAASMLNKIGLHYVVILLSGIANLGYENNHIEKTAEFIQDINATDVYISRFTPQPNTELFDLIKNKKIIFPSISDREIEHRAMIKTISRKNNHLIATRNVRGTYGVQFNR